MTVHVAATEPYAWPYDGRLHAAELALVLAGWDATWRSRAVGADAAGAAHAEQRCLQLADAVAGCGGLVIAVAHADAPPLPLPGARSVPVPGIDALHGSPIDAILRRSGRSHVLVAGHGLEAPVHSTLRSANDRGYECLLVTDASSTLQADLAGAAVKTVCMSGGIFGAVGASADVLDALPPPIAP